MLRTFVPLSEAKGREYGSPVQVFMRGMGAGTIVPLPFWFSLIFIVNEKKSKQIHE